MGGSLISVEEGYLLNSYQGIYLLDKDFKLIKQLFKNDVEFQRNGKRFFFQLNALLQSVYYNATHKQVQGRIQYISMRGIVPGLFWPFFPGMF